MTARLYRLPRRYRYRRSRRDGRAAVAAGAAAVAILAAGHAGHAHHAAGALPAAVPVTGSGAAAFIRAVLADLGAPATAADISSLAAWFPHEATAALNNPMATTMPAPGATVFNGAGVKDYPTASEGAAATARTLADGRYPLILSALMSGRGLCGDTSLSGEFLTWSGNGYAEVC